MELNLHVPFVGFDGEAIKENNKPKMIDETICLLLFAGNFIKSSNPDEEAKQKLDAFELYQKISQGKGVVDLTLEEKVLIKKAAIMLNPGGYGQIYKLIEGGK